jgi:hypothetical protein
MLHAWRLKITLPGEEARREFEAPPPEDFKRRLEWLRGSAVMHRHNVHNEGASTK